MRDRVLTKNGTFAPFPERYEKQAIKQGAKAAPADTGVKEPLIDNAAEAKKELALKMNEDAKKQAEMDKVIKERQLKKALEEDQIKEAVEKAGKNK